MGEFEKLGDSLLIKLSPHGVRLIKSIESEGSQPGQLKSPGGVRLSREGEVYFCDCENKFSVKISCSSVYLAKGEKVRGRR